MDDDELERYRALLLRLKAELEELTESSRESTQTVELDQPAIGRLSRMDAMQAQQMALDTARRREAQLQRIAGALRRIDTGDYGLCHVCDEPIDMRRLDIDPTTTRCIDCQDA
ncbi:MAG: TraR/DksA family transcriptional regulator [Pseudomonadota bacterium]